jgi:hypothetical protein
MKNYTKYFQPHHPVNSWYHNFKIWPTTQW